MAEFDAELKKEVLSAPRPFVYQVGLSDEGTLSSIARLFYNDGGKWKMIYEANKGTIKDPNVIRAGQKLTIPDLK